MVLIHVPGLSIGWECYCYFEFTKSGSYKIGEMPQ